jgi:ubiquinone/menaquinone biosynthesis C-methylase UbiE
MTGTRAERQSFDPLPAVYDRFAELVGRPLREYLAARLPPHGGRAVDLGCGTGQHATLLAEHYSEVLAVDVSGAMLHHAQTRRPMPNITYQHCDLREVIPDRAGRFDLVLSAYTLHHVARLEDTLRGIRNLLTDDGQAILVDNVDPRRRVARSWFVHQAVRGLGSDVLHHRRSVTEAIELFRLSTHPAWLDHLTSDVFLTPVEFRHLYLGVFPDAEITPMYRALALHWRQPR